MPSAVSSASVRRPVTPSGPVAAWAGRPGVRAVRASATEVAQAGMNLMGAPRLLMSALDGRAELQVTCGLGGESRAAIGADGGGTAGVRVLVVERDAVAA